MLQLRAHLHAVLSWNETVQATVLRFISLRHLARPESTQPAMLWQNTLHTPVPPSPPPPGEKGICLVLCFFQAPCWGPTPGWRSCKNIPEHQQCSWAARSALHVQHWVRHFGITKYYINRRGLCAHSMSLFVFPKIYWCDSWLGFSVPLMV